MCGFWRSEDEVLKGREGVLEKVARLVPPTRLRDVGLQLGAATPQQVKLELLPLDDAFQKNIRGALRIFHSSQVSDRSVSF